MSEILNRIFGDMDFYFADNNKIFLGGRRCIIFLKKSIKDYLVVTFYLIQDGLILFYSF